MRKKLCKIVSVFVAGIICCSSFTAFGAVSEGSNVNDKTAGYDMSQNVRTKYDEFDIGQDAKTNVYLTVDGNGVIAGVPTRVILDGDVALDGLSQGTYKVFAQGDIAGNKAVKIEPESSEAVLTQMGKSDMSASIEQNKVEFTSNDAANGATADGIISAEGLTAGSWNGEFNFVISMEDYVKRYTDSEIAQAVFGYNAESGLGFAYVGTENTKNSHFAITYDTYMLPVSALGLSTGDTLCCRSENQKWADGYLYDLTTYNANMERVTASIGWVASNMPKDLEITDDVKYVTFKVISGGYGNNLDFNKADIPLQDFKLYKNSVSDETKIDYISVWNDMINFDDSFEITQKKFGHNVEWDYVLEPLCTNSLEYRMNYYDMWDIDVMKTSDDVFVAGHDDKKYNITTSTYADLKAQYPDIMTMDEVFQWAKANGKHVYISSYSSYMADLVQKYDMMNQVHIQTAFAINPAPNTEKSQYDTHQWSCVGASHFNEANILSWMAKHDNLSLCSGGYGVTDYFTDEQIDWCIENGIEVGVGFFGGTVGYGCNSRTITPMLSFFRTHDQSTFSKIDYFMFDNEEYSESQIKAAYRYAYLYE